MKKYMVTAAMAVFVIATSLAQDNVDKKAGKKHEKMEKKTAEMDNAALKNKDREAERKMDKMNKKEKKMHRKAAKTK
jgi:Ni/Co efflux regulator RcnB